MTDRIRTLTDEALAMHRELSQLGIEQSKLAQQSLELARDSQHKIARMWIDAVAPKNPSTGA